MNLIPVSASSEHKTIAVDTEVSEASELSVAVKLISEAPADCRKTNRADATPAA